VTAPTGLTVELLDEDGSTWHDLSDYVLLADEYPVTITRGRPDEFSGVESGSCTFTLDNSDGTFTPGKTTSSLYPNITTDQRIRVYFEDTPDVYRFSGHVTSWVTEWPGGQNFAVTHVTAADRISVLARQPLHSPGVEHLKTVANLVAVYPLDERESHTAGFDASAQGRPKATIQTRGTGGGETGEAAFGFGAGGPTGVGGGASFWHGSTKTDHTYLHVDFPNDPLGDSWTGDKTLVLAFNFPQATTTSGHLLRLVADWGRAFAFGYDSAGSISASLSQGSGTGVDVFFTVASAGTYDDGEWHTAIVSYSPASGDAELWVDGTSVDTNTLGEYRWTPSLSNLYIGGGGPKGDGSRAYVSCAAVIADYLTDAEAAEISDGILAGFSGSDTSTERMARYLTWAGVAAADYTLDTGYETSMAHIETGDGGAWAAMEVVTETEGGITYVQRDGELVFRNRRAKWNGTAGLTVDQYGISKDSAFSVDTIGHTNHALAFSEEVGYYEAKNDADIAQRGVYYAEFPVATTTIGSLRRRAQWAVNRFSGDPEPRLKTVGIDLTSATSAVVDDALALDICDWIQVTGLDTTTAPAASVDLVIEGYTETISLNNWRIDFNTTPGKHHLVLKLDDATLGELDSNNNIGL
jgi:hypothetical protein